MNKTFKLSSRHINTTDLYPLVLKYIYKKQGYAFLPLEEPSGLTIHLRDICGYVQRAWRKDEELFVVIELFQMVPTAPRMKDLLEIDALRLYAYMLGAEGEIPELRALYFALEVKDKAA